MKRLIALSGKANVGKSSTIKTAYLMILKKFPDATVLNKKAESRKEIRVVLLINKTRVGIESRGDNRGAVIRAQQEFRKFKCEVVVCARRTRGGSWDAVDAFAKKNGFEITPIFKVSEAALVDQEASNKKDARQISKLVSNWVET